MLNKGLTKIVGVKQSVKTLKNFEDFESVQVYVAKDAEAKVVRPLIELASNKKLDITYIATMKELGQLCDIDVGAAAALILEDKILK